MLRGANVCSAQAGHRSEGAILVVVIRSSRSGAARTVADLGWSRRRAAVHYVRVLQVSAAHVYLTYP
jgi:hypothetical protein